MKQILRTLTLLTLVVLMLGCNCKKSSQHECGSGVNVAPVAVLTQSDNESRVDIPDAVFKNYLLEEVVYNILPFEQGKSVAGVRFYDMVYLPTAQKIDSNGDGEISIAEAERILFLKVNSLDIKNFTGLEYFPNLEGLVVNGVDSPRLDLSNNAKLKHLDCRKNNLAALDLSKNSELRVLYCGGNQLLALDLTANSALERFDCANNQISSLDLSNNVALEYVDCSSNQLTTLDVSKNTQLTALYCDYNPLTTLCVAAGHTFGHLSTPEDTTIANK